MKKLFCLVLCSSIILLDSSCATTQVGLESELTPETSEEAKFDFMWEVKEEDIRFYAISNKLQSTLLLFRDEDSFIFNWDFSANHHEVHPAKMKLSKGSNDSRSDKVYVALVSSTGTGVKCEDLHVVQFVDVEPGYWDYCLKGNELQDWVGAPIELKKPLQSNENIVMLNGKEFPVALSKSRDKAGDLLDVYYGAVVEFFFDDSGITVRIGVCADYSIWNYYGNFIGHVTANVHFEDGKFTLSDHKFVLDAP